MKTPARIAATAVLVTLALAFSYIESLIPFDLGIPGVKLGLANLVVLIALCRLTPGEALTINLVRAALSALLFGTVMSLAYSLAGGILSFFVMWLLKRSGKFSLLGVSLAGGVAHNVGQLLVAMAVLENLRLAVYAPVLLISGVVTGLLIGVAAQAVERHLPASLGR